ncbi:MAG TPA: 2Fe-2S iron-sulfur cluster-binding protein [Candidatus Hydrogenedentes bacterium]|nr:2Fe-2S iron-sulfur cluster-binding protein [Candidatus Hydrogenedentota bacterium]
MATIVYGGARFAPLPDETLLDCLLRNEVAAPHSCKSGVCQSCMMRVRKGQVPVASQKGLRDTLRAQGYFLACMCVPEEDLSVSDVDAQGMRVHAQIAAIESLNARVVRVRVRTESTIEHRAGQFVNFVREDGLVRSYSIASVPELDEMLDFHVLHMREGSMSGWLHSSGALGATIQLQGPSGNCFYVPGTPEQPLLLAGTGTGLAPLYGIIRDALHQGHAGPIYLFHGSIEPDSLYLVEELRRLAEENSNTSYHPCVLRGEQAGVVTEPLDAYVFKVLPSLKGFKVYLCGHPDFVKLMQRKTFLAGAGLADIYADAFVTAAAPQTV